MIFEKPFTPYLTSVKEEPLFRIIRELPAAEHALFRSHSSKIVDNYRDTQLYLISLLNYREYVKLDDSYSLQCTENAGKTPSLMGGELMILNMTRLIMNVLTTVRSYLDLTERNILHRYGEQSERYHTFKKTTGEAYDSSF